MGDAFCGDCGTSLAEVEADVDTAAAAQDRWYFGILRLLRLEVAKEEGVSAYVVSSDALLREIIRLKPRSPAALLSIKGMGQQRYKRFVRLFSGALEMFRAEGQLGHGVLKGRATVIPKPSLGIGKPIDPRADSEPRVAEVVDERAWTLEGVRKDFPRAYMPWSQEEDSRLNELVTQGFGIESLAAILERRPGAIESRLRRLGL